LDYSHNELFTASNMHRFRCKRDIWRCGNTFVIFLNFYAIERRHKPLKSFYFFRYFDIFKQVTKIYASGHI